MPKYAVEVPATTSIIRYIEANSPEEAKALVFDGEGEVPQHMVYSHYEDFTWNMNQATWKVTKCPEKGGETMRN